MNNKYDVGIDTTKLQPVSFDQVKKLKKKQKKQNKNKYMNLFESAIANKNNNVSIVGAFKRTDHRLIIDAINELIQREDIQNIHNIGNGSFIIEYEPRVI